MDGSQRRALAARAVRGLYVLLVIPAILAAAISPAMAAARVVFVGAFVDDSAGNNDGWLEPGETVVLKIELYNDGDVAATGNTGVLSYLGGAGDVTFNADTATWPDLPAKGAPAVSVSPHFQVKLDDGLPCGAILPMRLTVSSSGGPYVLDFLLKAGQRLDRDAKRDALRRIDAPEANFDGARPFDGLGSSVAWGDVNGDGFADLILGAPLSDSVGNARVDAGAVYLVYGRPAQWTDADLASPPSGMVRIWGSDAGDNLGAAVAAGDVNGDGFDDLVLGAPMSDSAGKSRAGAGEVYLVYGQAAALADVDLQTASAGVARFFGADPIDGAGSAIAVADVNQDGFDDLVVGAPNADSVNNLRARAGEIDLIYGQAAAWADTDLASLASGTVRLFGGASGESAGAAVAAGDVNGDGYADILIGVPGSATAYGARPGAGAVYVVYGQAASWTDIDLLSPPGGVSRVWGAQHDDGLGGAVATGDLNGDGYADMILGAPESAGMGDTRPAAGEVWVLYGKASNWIDPDLAAPPPGAVRFDGALPFDRLGESVASADLDGDGYDDLILGAPGAAGSGRDGSGAIAVVAGMSREWTDLDLASPPLGVTFFLGGADGDGLGSAVAGADVNGDGFRDLIAGAGAAGDPAAGKAGAGLAMIAYGRSAATFLVRSHPPSFIDASGGTKLALGCDDCSVPVTIGFDFPFYGDAFQTLYVGSNGLLSFAPIADAASAVPACLPSSGPNRLLIAPFWDDLNPGAGAAGSGVFALLQGTPPNRRLTIEWKDVPHKPNVGAATFEATLVESTGQIFFQYQDLDFGSGSFDAGAAAVVGVQNRTGAHGVAFSCFTNDVVASGQALRLGPTIPIVENRAESGVGAWTASGLWHLTTSACEVNQHSGATGWYYGQDASCNYDDPVSPINSGSLDLPEIPNLPADARVAFWSRRQTDGRAGFDLSKVQISTSGPAGPFADVLQQTDDTGVWKYSGVTNVGAPGGGPADIRFRFDTVDALSNGLLGWMVDDVQITGCNVPGALTTKARAEAFASSTAICSGGGGGLDSLGSYCGDGGPPATYQWRENGLDIVGATAASYVIPAGKPVGMYGYSVAITCSGGASDVSIPISVSVVSNPPSAVGSTLMVDNVADPAHLHFTWTDVPAASDYVVYRDTTKNGSFAVVVGTSSSGAAGMTVPTPPDTIVYYLVAARSSCGEGPKK